MLMISCTRGPLRKDGRRGKVRAVGGVEQTPGRPDRPREPVPHRPPGQEYSTAALPSFFFRFFVSLSSFFVLLLRWIVTGQCPRGQPTLTVSDGVDHKTQEEHQRQSAEALQGVALAIERAARRDDEARQRERLERRTQRADEARDERAARQRDHTEFVGRVQTTVESAVRGAQADAQRLADEARDEWQRQLADSLKEAMRLEIRETVALELKAQLAEAGADDAERKAERKLKKAEEVAAMVRDTCAAAVAEQIGRERERERRARELERANALGKQMEGLQLQLLALATTSEPAQQHE